MGGCRDLSRDGRSDASRPRAFHSRYSGVGDELRPGQDRLTDPSIDEAAALAELDGMVGTVNKMLSTLLPDEASTDMAKIKALRAFICEPGHWNDQKPFQYDLTDPLGQQPGAQLLAHYLATKKGNCVSMPMLFLALGEKLGLDFTLSSAPLHLFVKYTDRATGKTWNLQTTSGAGFTRDEHYRKQLAMTDEAIANGIYLKTMRRREALAMIATGILDALIASGRYEEAIAVADVLIEANPADTYSLMKKGTALLSDSATRRHREILERSGYSARRAHLSERTLSGQSRRLHQSRSAWPA